MGVFYQECLGLVRIGSVQYLVDSNKLKLLPNVLSPKRCQSDLVLSTCGKLVVKFPGNIALGSTQPLEFTLYVSAV